MKGLRITTKDIAGFREHLILEERSAATIQKYIRDVKAFTESKRILPSLRIFSAIQALTPQEFISSPPARNTVSVWKICG